MISGKWFPQGSDLTEVLSVRQAVFSRGGDDLDRDAQNVLVYMDDTPAATGRLRWKDDAFWLDEVCVLPDLRGKRLGDLTLRLLLFKAQSHFAREVRLRTPADTLGFFTRLGFRPVSESDGIIECALPGDEIDLDTCKSCKKKDCSRRVTG